MSIDSYDKMVESDGLKATIQLFEFFKDRNVPDFARLSVCLGFVAMSLEMKGSTSVKFQYPKGSVIAILEPNLKQGDSRHSKY